MLLIFLHTMCYAFKISQIIKNLFSFGYDNEFTDTLTVLIVYDKVRNNVLLSG